MSLLQDLLREIPLSSVLEQRVKLAEETLEANTKELERYKQRVAQVVD